MMTGQNERGRLDFALPVFTVTMSPVFRPIRMLSIPSAALSMSVW
jgi:hypothetical protein